MLRNQALIAFTFALLLATPSHAGVQLFFTSSAQPYGLTDPARAFQPTQGLGQDATYYQVAAFPPLEAWGQTPAINWHSGEFAYVWLRFSGEPDNRKIQGVELDLDGVPADVAYYIMDDLNGAYESKRWEGAFTPPGSPEFKRDPQVLAAVDTHGIRNRSEPVDSWNMYDNITRTALLGAVRFDSDGLRSLWVVTSPSPVPPPPPPLLWEFGQANWIPEPPGLLAATVLVGAGAGARRRRSS